MRAHPTWLVGKPTRIWPLVKRFGLFFGVDAYLTCRSRGHDWYGVGDYVEVSRSERERITHIFASQKVTCKYCQTAKVVTLILLYDDGKLYSVYSPNGEVKLI